jgi:hypothetical protein
VVADALSRKSMGSFAHIAEVRRPVVNEFQSLVSSGVKFETTNAESLLAHVEARSSLVDNIKETQDKDPYLKKVIEDIKLGKVSEFKIDSEGMLRFDTRLCVPNIEDLRKKILEEAHRSSYTIHPGSTKMYKDLKENYWWEGMKRDVAEFVSKCLICQQVKAEHQRPTSLFQRIEIP